MWRVERVAQVRYHLGVTPEVVGGAVERASVLELRDAVHLAIDPVEAQ